MNNLRVVLDNVIISAFLKPQSLPRRVLDHVLLMSLDNFGELRKRLLHRKFDRYVSRTLRLHFLHLLPALGEFVEDNTTITACRAPKDNKFLEVAVDGNADSLITGDADLLALHSFRGIEIFNPKVFSQLLTLGL